jgi:tetratricopeptide (TPR) repeat protein
MAPLPADAPVSVTLGQAGPRNVAIEKAQGQIEAGDFEQAVKTLQGGLSEPDVTDDQMVELYRLLGLAQLYLGNEERARDAFEKLLQARPDFDLPRSEPPKIRALYARIKDDVKKRRVRPVTITVQPVTDVPGEQPLEVAAKIENLGLGAKAKLYYRRSGGQSFSSVDFVRQKEPKDEFRATLPAYEVPSEARAYEMDYYVEVADAAQRRLAGRGDPYNPQTFRVVAKEETAGPAVAEESPWYKNPWIWAGIGVVAAGAATGIVVVATQKQVGTLPISIKIEGAP